jgi:sugar lactone lactonase YvrE
MRTGYSIVATLFFWLSATVTPGFAAPDQFAADAVLGQAEFQTWRANSVDASGLFYPSAVAIDNSDTPHHLYVADLGNSRVLGWRDASAVENGAPADLVIGQQDFRTYVCGAVGKAPNPEPPLANHLCQPAGLAVDRAGNLYVAEPRANRVLRFDAPFRSCSSFPCVAGSAKLAFGQPDLTSGKCNQGRSAPDSDTLCGPQAVSVDRMGQVYIADTGNNRVVVYADPLADNDHKRAKRVIGQRGSFKDGQCRHDLSGLCQPFGVTVGRDGDVYVAESADNRIVRYAAGTDNGSLSVGSNEPAGPGCGYFRQTPTNAAALCSPRAVALDAARDLFVADAQNNRVTEYKAPLPVNQKPAQTAATRIFGQPDEHGSSCNQSTFLREGSVTVTTVNPGTMCLTTLGEPTMIFEYPVLIGFSSGIKYASPLSTGIAVEDDRFLWVADAGNNRVMRYELGPSSAAARADRVLGQANFSANTPDMVKGAGLSGPTNVAIDRSATPNRLYVADSSNNRVLGWRDAAGFTNGASADIVIGQPDFYSSYCDSLGPNTPAPKVDATMLCTPSGLAVDRAGNLYVSDVGNSRVLVFHDPFQAFAEARRVSASAVFGQRGDFTTRFIGANQRMAPPQPPISADTLTYPRGVALDSKGNLYIADTQANRVLEYDRPLAPGMGTPGHSGSVGDTTADRVFGQDNFEGRVASAVFNPQAVAVDRNDRLYIVDSSNNRVLVYDQPLSRQEPDHVIGQKDFSSRTCWGYSNEWSPNPKPQPNPVATADNLCGPGGIAVDDRGRVFVSDGGRLLEYDQPMSRTIADRIFGWRRDFSYTGCNRQTPQGSWISWEAGADTLCVPVGLAVDAAGKLYVVDSGNNRVLRFDQPLGASR